MYKLIFRRTQQQALTFLDNKKRWIYIYFVSSINIKYLYCCILYLLRRFLLGAHLTHSYLNRYNRSDHSKAKFNHRTYNNPTRNLFSCYNNSSIQFGLLNLLCYGSDSLKICCDILISCYDIYKKPQ